MRVHEEEPFNAEPLPSVLLESDRTGADAFYCRNHGPIPDLDPAGWRLQVRGLVERSLRLSLDDLQRGFERHELTATLQCAGNRREGLMEVRDIPGEAPWGPGATSNARWAGVRLGDVLDRAGLRPDAGHVEFLGPDVSSIADPPDVYGSSIVRHKALAPETLLAWEMNGEPLPRVHGGPVRVIVPGYIGARSVKWVQQVTARAEPSDNYFQATAYRLLPAEADPSAAGPGDGLSLSSVALNSAILTPDDHQQVPAGRTRVAGYALAGDDRWVARVDVSADSGASWAQATLDEPSSAWSWQLWHTEFDLSAGTTEIVARAWDSAAAAQPEDPHHLWNPKGYINNSWARVRLRVTEVPQGAPRSGERSTVARRHCG